MSKDNHETIRRDKKSWRVSVCSSAYSTNVQGFIDELSSKFPDLDLDVQYQHLPYNDIDHCEIKGSDVNIMILCHSINNRGFAITDVMDALYDKFLPKSANLLGKARICVIVHDFPSSNIFDTPGYYGETMKTFESQQGTACKHSSLVMMCGKLDGPVEMQETNWEDLKEFLVKAATTPMPSKSWWQPPLNLCRRLVRGIYDVIATVVTFGLGVVLGKPHNTSTITKGVGF
eukprot:XP_003727664.1 PREDICTED: uncharacterized protein LOC100888558 [Strongylocentrotus purpuratus]